MPEQPATALYSGQQIRDIEKQFAQASENGTYPLMEAAGLAAFEQLQEHWPKANRILVVSGRGNNAGDGFVVARLALQKHYQVILCSPGGLPKFNGDALRAFNQLQQQGIEIVEFSNVELDQFDVIVDAMLGTGICGALKPPFADAIQRINHSHTPVLSLDLPSGLNADTGFQINGAIHANLTTTFIGHKCGLWTGEAADYCGKIVLCDLDVPLPIFQAQPPFAIANNWSSVANRMPLRKLTSHKGDFGHCLIIGGAAGMTGAVILAASASARTGSGLTSAWIQQGAQALLAHRPEVMVSEINLDEIADSLNNIGNINSLVIGPGLGQTCWSTRWTELISQNVKLNTVNKIVDADALNWLAKNPEYDSCRILTPHPKEASRLLGISVEQVNQDRFAASAKIADQFGGVCVLKGAGTIISDGFGRRSVCTVSNPGMASGGMGDVLSGVIGGFLAQGLELFDAAELGVCLHAEAAQQVAGVGRLYRGMLASDLIGKFNVLLNP